MNKTHFSIFERILYYPVFLITVAWAFLGIVQIIPNQDFRWPAFFFQIAIMIVALVFWKLPGLVKERPKMSRIILTFGFLSVCAGCIYLGLKLHNQVQQANDRMKVQRQ